MLTDTVNVQVAGTVREYAQDVAGYGEHLARGGKTVGLSTALREAKDFFRANRDEMWTSVAYWVVLDDSGLAYRIEVNRHGSRVIKGAAPMPGPGNVRDLYVA